MKGLRGAGMHGMVINSAPCPPVGLPPNGMVAVMGDSLTAASLNYFLKNYDSTLVAGAYSAYALTLPETGDSISSGQLVPGGVFAQTGMNIAQIRDTWLPLCIAANPRPGICLVLAGTNNLGGLTNQAAYDAAIAGLRTIYTTLIANDILPIALGLPTYTNATYRPRIPVLNAQIETLAIELSVPYYDFYPLTDNGVDGWITGYSSDAAGAHWNDVGARIAGQAVRDTVLQRYTAGFSAANLVTAETQSDPDILWLNGAFTADSNGDGIPDVGWWVPSGGASMEFSLAAEPGVVSGNWWRLHRVNSSVSLQIYGESTTLTEGDTIEFGFMCKVLDPQPGTITFSCYDKVNTTKSVIKWQLSGLSGNIPPFKTVKKYIVPAGVTLLRMNMTITGGTVDLYLGQFTIRRV